MNIIMNTNKRDIIQHLIDFMIDNYYKIYSNNLNDADQLI